jgi:hypothetical protein
MYYPSNSRIEDDLAGWDWPLSFYHGTNLLMSQVYFKGKFVLADDAEFWDESGVLEQLHARLLREAELFRTNSAAAHALPR